MTDDITAGLTIPESKPDAGIPAPAKLSPDVNPFDDDDSFAPELSAAPTPILERMRLHFKQAQTKETPVAALSHLGDTSIERGARARGNASDLENEAIDRAVKTREDLAAYDRMPGAEGFLEYGAAITAHIAGNLADPTSLIGNVVKIPYLASKGVLGRMAEFGVNQAIVNTATDPVVQGLNIAANDGTRDHYDFSQTFLEAPISGFIGGALLKGAHEAGSALFIRPKGEKIALDFFRTVRDQADWAKQYPDIAKEVAGKSDKQLGDMAKEIVADDKVAGDKEPAKTEPVKPTEPPVSDEPIRPAEPPVVEPKVEGPPLLGEAAPKMFPHRVTDTSGRTVEVTPIIMEAKDLKASNDPGYDPALQPRDRDRAASQAQITNISARLDPERLGQSPEASHGAPIIGDDGMVESGNGRVMAIRDAYKQNNDAAARYRDWLKAQGVDVSKYKEPVLVRQRTTPLTPEERQAFTVSANQSSLLAMSAPERALADARRITVNDLDQITVPNDLGAAGNQGFINAFIAKLPQAEHGALMDASGKVTQAGLIRVRDAILARAYGDSHILTRIAESTDDDVKSISNALVASAPLWAKFRADVEAGIVRPDMDITPELIEAVRRTADLRARGVKLDNHLAQIDALDPLPENVEWFMKLFYNESGRRAASADTMAKKIRYYTEEAGKVMADAGLDLGMTPVMPRDILRTAAEKGFAHERAKGEKAGDLFGGSTGDGKNGDAGSVGEPRPGDAGGSEGVREPGVGGDPNRQPDIGAEAGSTEREVANGLTLDRARQLASEAQAREYADILAAFDGDAAKAKQYSMLWRQMMSDDDAVAVPARAAMNDLAKTLSPEKLAALEKEYPEEATSDWWRSVADTINQHTSHDAKELADNLAHALIDAPDHADWSRMSSREKLSVVAANTVLRDANTLGISMTDVLKKVPAAVKARYGDSQDAGFMLDIIKGSLAGQREGAPVAVDPGREVAARVLTPEQQAARDAMLASPDHKASEAMNNALDKLEEAIESGDRKAVAEQVKEAKKVLADTPQEIRDVDPEYWGQFDKLIKKMARKGYVTGKQQAEIEARMAADDAKPGIGDVLAAEHDATAGPDEALGTTMRRMQYSHPRESEATRSNLTSNFVEAPNLRTLWTDLARELGAIVRGGRVQGSKNTLGQYFLRSGVIRMRQLDDPVVLAHEIGHHIEDYFGKPLQDLIHGRAPNRSIFGGRELDFMTSYAASHQDPVVRRKEGFAEFFRLLLEHPAEADRRAPNFKRDFDTLLATEPELKATIEKAQRGFDDYRTANAEDLVDANIHTAADPSGWEKLRGDVRNDGFWNTIAERGSRVYTGIIDDKNSLARMVQQLLAVQKENTGKVISLIAADDAYKLIRLATNAHQAGMIDMMHGVTPYKSNTPEGPSLHDAIALATGKPNILSGWDDAKVNSFSGYLISLRGVFEWERHAAGVHSRDPMPFAKDIYEQKIKVYEAANPNAREAANMVQEWARNMLKKERDAGLITNETYDNALQVRDYVPLLRDMSDKSQKFESEQFDALNVGLRQFRGSSRPIIDPLESLMTRSFHTAELIAHNDAIGALSNLAVKAGVGGGKFVERIPASEIKAKYVDPMEALRKGLQDNGALKDDADLAISNMLNSLRIDEQDMGPVAIFRSQTASELGENVVFHLVGGELRALRLLEGDAGREVIKVLTDGMSTQLRDWNLQALAKVSQVLRAGVTTSPDFFITNSIRDQVSTWILNRGTLPVLDWARGIYRELTNNELSRTFAQMGGIAGGANLNGLDHARIDKDILALANKGMTVRRMFSWESYFKAIELSETASRGGLFGVAYERSLKQGLSPYEASVEAAFIANDNLDFGRHGSRLGATAKIVPFLNAALQGLDKAYRTLVEPAFKERLTAQDREAQKTMVSAYAKITALTGLSMALRAAYIDDPEYSELSEYMRNTHWVVRVPGIKGNSLIDATGKTIEVPEGGLQNLWLAIPKPFELAILPNLGERAVEMLHNDDPKALARWAWGALDLVKAKWMMDSVGVKLAAELKTGKDTFANRDIVPEHVAGREPWMQATAGASAIGKKIGAAMDSVHKATGLGPEGGVSPMYVDHIVKGVGGSWGRTFLSLTDMAMGTKGDQSFADTAITRRVFKEAYRGSTSTAEFWGQVARTNGKLSQAANTYDALGSNPEEQAKYVAGLPEDRRVFVIMNKSDFPADQKRLHPMYRAHEAVTAISNMKREIANNGLAGAADLEPIKLSSSEQRVALDSLSRIQMWEARNALIVSGSPALKGQKPGPIEADMEMLEKTVPTVYNELQQRYANAKIYKAEAVARNWDEVKQSVMDDGSDAKLATISHEVQREGFELDGHRDKKKKVKPVIPGLRN